MEKFAKKISEILHDYHNNEGFQFSPNHILNWVGQFDSQDQKFILEELLYLLNHGIYISQKKARQLLHNGIKQLAIRNNLSRVSDFLKNAEILKLQPEHKSQGVLLGMLDEILNTEYGMSLQECGKKSSKYVVYLDDILATGNTAYQDLKKWLLLTNTSKKTNLEDVVSGNKKLTVFVFCLHTWPLSTIGWRLKNVLKCDDINNKISYLSSYEIENHPTKPRQKFNLIYPTQRQSSNILEYLDNLQSGYTFKMSKREFAFRKEETPEKETFFSSRENRIRFENIILTKGLEILNQTNSLNHNQRPLGNINPSFQTLGTGTLFFTWRNVSNTTPIVFWWDVKNKSSFKGLFPLANRGI